MTERIRPSCFDFLYDFAFVFGVLLLVYNYKNKAIQSSGIICKLSLLKSDNIKINRNPFMNTHPFAKSHLPHH